MGRKKILVMILVIAVLITAGLFFFWYRSPEKLPNDNLLQNPGFEDPHSPAWTYPEWSEAWKGFEVCRRPHTGWRSACLRVEEDPKMSTAIWGVRQEVNPQAFPRYISGFVRQDQWEQGTMKMYLQVVLICWFKKPRAGMNNIQVRFLLGGVAHHPFRMNNVRYILVREAPPEAGEWMSFTLDAAQAFKELWGYPPDEWARLEVFFEARYDDRKDTDGPVRARVFYDDLYLGNTKIPAQVEYTGRREK